MTEEKQEAKQELKVSRRRALLYLLGASGAALATMGAALITKVTTSDHEVGPQCRPVLCEPSLDKCAPWAGPVPTRS